jgi:hypothetical protein
MNPIDYQMVNSKVSSDHINSNILLDTYVTLTHGEIVKLSLKGDAYNMSPSILARMLATIESVFAFITGTSKKTTIYSTNRRVILITQQKLLWVIDGGISVVSYTPRSIESVGYELKRSFIFFKSHYLSFSAGKSSLVIKSIEGKMIILKMVGSIMELSEKVSFSKNNMTHSIESEDTPRSGA